MCFTQIIQYNLWVSNDAFVEIIVLRTLPVHIENCIHFGEIDSIYMRVWAHFFYQSFLFSKIILYCVVQLNTLFMGVVRHHKIVFLKWPFLRLVKLLFYFFQFVLTNGVGGRDLNSQAIIFMQVI